MKDVTLIEKRSNRNEGFKEKPHKTHKEGWNFPLKSLTYMKEKRNLFGLLGCLPLGQAPIFLFRPPQETKMKNGEKQVCAAYFYV